MAVSGVVAGVAMWLATILGTANLHPSERLAVQLILVSWSVLCGLTTGMVVRRRQGRPDEVLFGVTAGAVGGGLCGAAYAVVIGVTYVATYGGSPVDVTDAIVLALSFPVFAALGALVGTVPGSLCGLCAGLLMRRMPAPGLTG